MNVAEVVYYNQGLNEAQNKIVHNYLAAKYGFALKDENDADVTMYANQDYNYGVIGIGMDLNQDGTTTGKQAASSGDALVLEELNNTLTVGEYVFAGNNGEAVNTADAWERTWNVKPVGGDVDVKMSFDFAAAGLETPASAEGYSLYFDDGNGFVALELTGSLDGSKVVFEVPAVAAGIYGVGKNVPGSGGCSAAKPTITLSNQNGNGAFTLTSDQDEGNQWMLDGNSIEGATAKTFQPDQIGTFTVSYAEGGCPAVVSDPVVVTSLDDNLMAGVKIYPNPTEGRISISLPTLERSDNAVIELYDLSGHRLYSMAVDRGMDQVEVDLRSVPKGIYLLKVNSRDVSVNHRIIKN